MELVGSLIPSHVFIYFYYQYLEGLTVFRDQEFSGDMNSKAVNRIENVRGLRARQFNEDAGPMSHPIRPESYISMGMFILCCFSYKLLEE